MSLIEHAQSTRHYPRPPQVKGRPVFGRLQNLLKNPHAFVKQAYRRYGEVFRFRALFCVDGFWGKAMHYMGCPTSNATVRRAMNTAIRLMLPLAKDRICVLARAWRISSCR